MTNTTLVKVLFPLERDEDGYPPEDWESVWAHSIGGDHYRVDNIPFFIMGISHNDIVSAEKKDGELRFIELIEPSDRCTVRVIIYNTDHEECIRNSLKNLHCDIEGTGIEGMIAIDVEKKRYKSVEKYLDKAFRKEVLDYQEATLR